MKKLVYILLIVFPVICFSCGNEKTSNEESTLSNDSISNKQETDSLASLIHTLDSITNSGDLVHIDIYQIGKLKGQIKAGQRVSLLTLTNPTRT